MTRAEESARVYEGLLDLLEKRLAILFAKTGPDWKHYVGPAYDPTKGSSGAGQTCSKCRRIYRSDVRVCPSCGMMAP